MKRIKDYLHNKEGNPKKPILKRPDYIRFFPEKLDPSGNGVITNKIVNFREIVTGYPKGYRGRSIQI